MEQKSLFTHDVPKNFLELWTLTDAMGELQVLVGDGDGDDATEISFYC